MSPASNLAKAVWVRACCGSACGARQGAVATMSPHGGLDVGENPQDDTWDQPLSFFTVAADLSSFTMRGLGGPPGSDDRGVEVPNRNPSRAHFNLDGTETSRALEATSACLRP